MLLNIEINFDLKENYSIVKCYFLYSDSGWYLWCFTLYSDSGWCLWCFTFYSDWVMSVMFFYLVPIFFLNVANNHDFCILCYLYKRLRLKYILIFQSKPVTHMQLFVKCMCYSLFCISCSGGYGNLPEEAIILHCWLGCRIHLILNQGCVVVFSHQSAGTHSPDICISGWLHVTDLVAYAGIKP